LRITNWEFISRDGGSTGRVLFKMAAAAILDFEKLSAITLLFDRSSPKLVETLGLRFRTHYTKNAWLSKCKMMDATILNLRKWLSFLYYLTNQY